MFSAFLSRLRLNAAEQNSDDIDDTSSTSRSLNLPWPVTESSARRPTTTNLVNTQWTYGQSGSQASGTSGITISRPIPRAGPNSLTGFDDYYTATSASGSSHGRQVLPSAPWTATLSEKTRGIDSRPLGQTPMVYGPPAVVRLDSGGGENNDDNTTKDMDVPPPSYVFEQANASTIALPYPQSAIGYTNTNAHVHQTHSNLSREYDPEPEFYSSPFDDSDPENSTPAAPLSANTSSSTSTPKPGTMTKSRWGLKLQLHAAQSMPSLPTGGGKPQAPSNHPRAGLSDPIANPQVNPIAGVNVETDVFRHAYNYPLAKQLSPIVEQDYFSPVMESDSRSLSLKFGRATTSGSEGKPSPAESGSGSIREGVKEKETGNDGSTAEKESPKTRTGSSRTGSGGSIGTVNGMSRTGSTSMGVGGAQGTSPGGSLGEISRPSPIYASPFITRHLNRTVSQTSSKSDPLSQPAGAQTPTQGQGSPQLPAQIPTHLQGPSRAGTVNNVSTPSAPRSTTNSNPNKGSIETPTSASTTGTGTATIYTPTSAAPTVKTQISPNVGSGVPIQHPPAAATTSTTTMVFPLPPQFDPPSHLPKIPSLPAMAPLDLRFSLLGSVSPRTSREVRTPHAGGTPLKAVGAVERMPVIDGSVEGRDEEDEEYDDDDYDDIHVVIEGEEYDAEEYDRESLHAESFVTAGSNEHGGSNDKNHHRNLEQGMELATLNKSSPKDIPPSSTSLYARPKDPLSLSASSREPTHVHDSGLGSSVPDSAGESFIHKRWDKDALGFGPATSSPTFQPKGGNLQWPLRFSSSSSSLTPAFWTFWLGFICPFLWLVGGWHFTNAGELPPKLTVWEWYFWKSGWTVGGCFRAVGDKLFGCCTARRGRRASRGGVAKEVRGSQGDGVIGEQQPARRNGGKRRSASQSKARSGKVYPALPRWVAEKQSTDDGRMRLNDPRRSLRGISFGYPFISRPQTSQDSYNSKPQPLPSSSPLIVRILKRIGEVLSKPNRVLDMLYGVKLREVRGRPESGRRMFDPWIQRCRYALCYGMALLAIGLCIASTYLIIVSTRKLV